MNYLEYAPKCLVMLHKNTNVKKARNLLGLLLTRDEMRDVWRRLSHRISSDRDWGFLWQEIIEAIKLANPKRKPKRVEYEIDDLMLIADRANELAKEIRIEPRTPGYKGYLDFPCHQFFSDDVMTINGIEGWSRLDSIQQCAIAANVLNEWPTMGELLDALAQMALKKASEVDVKRIVKKDKDRWSETTFSRVIYRHLAAYNWAKKDCIFANIAAIANLAIEAKLLKTHDEGSITAKFVGKAVL